jgi:hypothetical protein
MYSRASRSALALTRASSRDQRPRRELRLVVLGLAPLLLQGGHEIKGREGNCDQYRKSLRKPVSWLLCVTRSKAAKGIATPPTFRRSPRTFRHEIKGREGELRHDLIGGNVRLNLTPSHEIKGHEGNCGPAPTIRAAQFRRAAKSRDQRPRRELRQDRQEGNPGLFVLLLSRSKP